MHQAKHSPKFCCSIFILNTNLKLWVKNSFLLKKPQIHHYLSSWIYHMEINEKKGTNNSKAWWLLEEVENGLFSVINSFGKTVFKFMIRTKNYFGSVFNSRGYRTWGQETWTREDKSTFRPLVHLAPYSVPSSSNGKGVLREQAWEQPLSAVHLTPCCEDRQF